MLRAFTFPTYLARKQVYSVTVLNQPEGQLCTVGNSTGAMTSSSITNVAVSCAIEWVVSTLAGGTPGYLDGQGSQASFLRTPGVVGDQQGAFYVTDAGNNRIRKVFADGTVTTVAGSGSSGASDGVGQAASFNNPYGIAMEPSGNLVIADNESHKIRRLTPAGEVSTIAGTGNPGATDGSALQASFYRPSGVAVDSQGNIYVADFSNGRVRRISQVGDVSTVAHLASPFGIAIDRNDNVLVSDGDQIKKITSAGTISTIVPSGAGLINPGGIAFDDADNLYVSELSFLEPNGSKIKLVTPAGVVSTIAGSGVYGYQDGYGSQAAFRVPVGLFMTPNGTLVVADLQNSKIRILVKPTN
jgi:serine/threonine protein kinase, bacterial